MSVLNSLAHAVVVKPMNKLRDDDTAPIDESLHEHGDYIRPDLLLSREFHCHDPYSGIGLAEVNKAISELIASCPPFSKALGCLIGLVVGDTVGAPMEFLPASEIPNKNHYVTTKQKSPQTFSWFNQSTNVRRGLFYTGPNNVFFLKEGQWTDDSSMALCLADSLIFNGAYDGVDVRFRFLYWLKYGYSNAFAYDLERYNQTSVGLGGNIGKSLRSIRLLSDVTSRYMPKTPNNDSGNGSIMRLAPSAIFFHKNQSDAQFYSREQSYTTHPGEIAAEACEFLGFLLFKLLNVPTSSLLSLRELLDEFISEYLLILNDRSSDSTALSLKQLLLSNASKDSTEACWNWRNPILPIQDTLNARGSNYNGYPNSASYFGSYSLDALAIALHSCYTTLSFEDAILKTVNFLGDADSTGAVTGQIAGAFYGAENIPDFMRKPIEKWDHGSIALRAALMYFYENVASEFSG
ncbi:hypothetical protein HDU83_008035 [Entophlyctis luteolus]|nr:hypothetical protein HDU83_008035 [Entophlyctis luteolus]